MRIKTATALLLPILAMALPSEAAVRPASLRVLVNHLGYEPRGSKKVIVETEDGTNATSFQVLDEQGKVALEGTLGKREKVDNWKRWTFFRGDFSALEKPGKYRIRAVAPTGEALSEPFAVTAGLLPETCISDMLFFFKSQRSSGIYDRTDRAVPFFGGKRPPADVHGGWYDASGDVSKYLSHLSYANFMNPQQTPLVVWSFLESAALLKGNKSLRLESMIALLEEEALFGADFLVRMQDPSGYFYMTVFDGWSHDAKRREICAYKTQEGHKNTDYQAAFREGGGMAIAALARVSTLGQKGDYPAARYLAAAEKGFAHLQKNNLRYVDDHLENIIDDYCALLAATELYKATKKPEYLQAARQRRESLVKRLHKDARYSGFWRADGKDRPYFHGVEAGLPVLALLRYRAIEPDAALGKATLEAVRQSLAFELGITRETANPFGYARQYIKAVDAPARSSFFIPHKNESGYWWQGESSRLASLAAAARLASRELEPQRRELRAYATDQIDWILGLNPFDVSMLQGRGRNSPDYVPETPNVPGGVCNGVTAGYDDEHDIAFLPAPFDKDANQNWRWSEQWIQHDAWLILALATQAAVE